MSTVVDQLSQRIAEGVVTQPLDSQIASRKRGRPLEMSQSEVLARIRHLAATESGLFRIHHTHSDLYARARRQFGSWAAAVSAAGVDYTTAVNAARQRATETRRLRLRSDSARP